MKLHSKKSSNRLHQAGLRIVRLLHQEGHKAFWVGGTVRDLILGVKSDNLDIATSATPDNVQKILNANKIQNKAIGKQFGTILAIAEGCKIEITTFRREGYYSDKRHPDKVEFIGDFKLDARRRDFTINAIYFDPITKQVYDETGGISDIQRKIIKFVGNPKKRIDEDHLRMLRAVRFSTLLGFKIEKNSFAAIKIRAKLIQKVSAERVKQELDKILLSKNRSAGIRLLDSIGLLKFLSPETSELKKIIHGSKKYHLEGDVLTHTLKVMDLLPANLDLIYAALFHDAGKIHAGKKIFKKGEWVNTFYGHQKFSAEYFDQFARTFKFPRSSLNKAKWLILRHDDRTAYAQMKMINRIKYSSHPFFPDLVLLWKADSGGNLRLDEGTGHSKPGESPAVKLALETIRLIDQKRNLVDRLASGDLIKSELKIDSGIRIGSIKDKITEKILVSEIKNLSDVKNFLKKFQKYT